MTTKDVVIVGAGVAGSTAGFHLAQAGKKIAILEKNHQNIIKPCGGGMASSVQQWFPFDLKPLVEEAIRTVEFSWNLSDPVTANLSDSEPFWIIRRDILDEFLRNKAINAGAELIRPFQVTDLSKNKNIWQVSSADGRQIEAKSIIIADGSASPWPKKFNLGPKQQRHASTISLRLKGRGSLKEGTARFEFGLVHHGFAWAFPLDGEINIGIGSLLGENNKINSEYILKKLLPNLGLEFTNQKPVTTSLRVWNGHSKIHGEGIIAIGDAASLCDPFLAEGLRPALMSGFEAAESLNNWLNGNNEDLSSYTKSIKKNWGDSMAWGKRISQVFYRFPKIGYQLGIKRPTAPKRIAQILSGEMSYEDIAQRVIKRLLFQQ